MFDQVVRLFVYNKIGLQAECSIYLQVNIKSKELWPILPHVPPRF
jgi:hypothetical protein